MSGGTLLGARIVPHLTRLKRTSIGSQNPAGSGENGPLLTSADQLCDDGQPQFRSFETDVVGWLRKTHWRLEFTALSCR
jgi:hypothetical protein